MLSSARIPAEGRDNQDEILRHEAAQHVSIRSPARFGGEPAVTCVSIRSRPEGRDNHASDDLSWLQAWHIRDETYSAALAEVVNAQYRQPFALWWGKGATSSSDGQHFKAGGRGQFAGQMNPRYGSEPGVQFYTHVSDHYAPFHTKVINATVRDATHVLDGLLYHESDLRIEEHYTDTTGFTDHVFALMHLLGFRFAPRIRDLADGNRHQYKRVNGPYKLIMIAGGDNKLPYGSLPRLLLAWVSIEAVRGTGERFRTAEAGKRRGSIAARRPLHHR